MPTVLSKHKGELFEKRINVKINSHWYYLPKSSNLTGLGVVVANSTLSYNKFKIPILVSHYLTYEGKNNYINWF